MTTSSFVLLAPAKKAMAGSAGGAAQPVRAYSEIAARVNRVVRTARRDLRLSNIGKSSVGFGDWGYKVAVWLAAQVFPQSLAGHRRTRRFMVSSFSLMLSPQPQ